MIISLPTQTRPVEPKMKQIEVKLSDVPELPLEKIFSYLPLKDLIRLRRVSRRWCQTVDCFRVKSLCFSSLNCGFIESGSRWVSGPYAQNFIHSPSFASFLFIFSQSIFCSLKHLRLCKLNSDDIQVFASTINSFAQSLNELDIIRFNNRCERFDLELNLPVLKSIRFERAYGFQKLTLNTPKLQNVRLSSFSAFLKLTVVHTESIEKLITDGSKYLPVMQLKSLKYLYIGDSSEINSKFLASLKFLKAIHLIDRDKVATFFEQKRRYCRINLKIYLNGLLLNGPDDPAIGSLSYDFDREIIACLIENQWRLADEVPLRDCLYYTAFEIVTPGLEINVLNRFIDLNKIIVSRPVQDIERFLNLLKNFANIYSLIFQCDQPHVLLDRLPDHCALQSLRICKPSDPNFLFRLRRMIHLYLDWSVHSELIRKALEEFDFLSSFIFKYNDDHALIRIGHPKDYKVSIGIYWDAVYDVDAVIQLLFAHAPQRQPNQRVAKCSLI